MNGVAIPIGGVRANGRCTIVSTDDAQLISSMTLCVSGKTGTTRPYVQNSKREYIHRIITNAPPGMDVDHINGDTLDNRRENLRVVTRSKNLLCSNHKKSGCLSKYRGVSLAKKKGRFYAWQAGVFVNNKRRHLGFFQNEEDAHNAYEKARLELLSK